MSNDLVIMEQRPAFLRDTTPTSADEFRSGLVSGIALPFLSIRGKVFRIRKDGQEIPLRVNELPIVFIAARPNVSKRYYDAAYASDMSAMPACHSMDGVTPDVANPVHPDCASCPKNAWGSKITPSGKKAKECQDYKRLIVGIFGEKDLMPVVFDVPATSLKAPRGQRHQDTMMLREYLDTIARHAIDPITAVTKLFFTDAEYPQVSFSFGGYVSENIWHRALELRDDKDVLEALGNGDIYDFPPPEPAPVDGTGEAAQTPAGGTGAAAQTPAGGPGATARAPKQAPLPGQTATDQAGGAPTIESLGDEDLMSEIEKLLKG